jgi:uncharacterized protein YbgA (DUF1722 family)/uncharacterized protein YbbK (DUF523 family)
VCPEVEVGMGTPRETLRLVRDRTGLVRMLTTRTGIDHTASMTAWSRQRLDRLASERLSGYVLKKDSPSCGMERVKVFGPGGMPRRNGRGIFAEALLAHFPNLPVEDEGRLSDPHVRVNFIERVFAYQRLRRLFDSRWTTGALGRFHTAHKMSLLSHSSVAYRKLGRLVASASEMPRSRLREQYERGFMHTMGIVATPLRHTRVLTHIAGHLEKQLDPDSMGELLSRVNDYHRGRASLVVPLTLLRLHVRAHDVVALAGQTYLELHPRELMLCNRG